MGNLPAHSFERRVHLPLKAILTFIRICWTKQVENDVVWDAMQPALRLASKILENSHSWPWWAVPCLVKILLMRVGSKHSLIHSATKWFTIPYCRWSIRIATMNDLDLGPLTLQHKIELSCTKSSLSLVRKSSLISHLGCSKQGLIAPLLNQKVSHTQLLHGMEQYAILVTSYWAFDIPHMSKGFPRWENAVPLQPGYRSSPWVYSKLLPLEGSISDQCSMLCGTICNQQSILICWIKNHTLKMRQWLNC